MATNPYVFLVGCGRSGTTLLRRIVEAHPRIAFPKGETHWIPRTFTNRDAVDPNGQVRKGIVDVLLADKHFARNPIERSELEGLLRLPNQSYRDFVTSFFDLWGERQGKPLAGDKTPGYVRNIPLLAELWPEARFVHLIRDGRNVWLSLADWDRGAVRLDTWESDPVTTGALWWEWHVRLGRDAREELGEERYHEVTYEDLVTSPDKTCRRLCAFLGVEYEPAMLKFHEGKTKSSSGLSAKKAWLPITPGLRDWRSQMTPNQRLRFDAISGEILDELGYETSEDRELADERAVWVRRAFIQLLERRGSLVPSAWKEHAP